MRDYAKIAHELSNFFNLDKNIFTIKKEGIIENFEGDVILYEREQIVNNYILSYQYTLNKKDEVSCIRLHYNQNELSKLADFLNDFLNDDIGAEELLFIENLRQGRHCQLGITNSNESESLFVISYGTFQCFIDIKAT